MTTFRPRSDLIDAGLKWLGPVPREWTIRRLGHYFSERREKVSDKEFSPLSVTMKGVVSQLESVAKTDDGDNRKRVCAGDFVINSRSDRKGSGGVSPLDGSVSLINTVLEPTDGMHIRFAGYLLTSYPFQEEFYRVGNGIVADMWTTKYSTMKNIQVVLPALDEQVAIADHLDRATTRIDALVAKKTRFIGLLREKRQALITHAVTKGLDASAPMKDSGVEWLGKVPSHWSIPAIKHLVSTPITDGPHETPVKHDSGVRFISAEAISGGRVDFSKAWGFISAADDARFSRKYRPAVNDIYMIKSGATTGVVAIVEDDANFNIWSPLAAIRPNSKVVPKFLLYALRSAEFQAGVALNWSYGTQQNIGMKVLARLPAPVPPVIEQQAIVAHLDRATSSIDTLIAKTEHSIRLLREHRTALITAAVTGKIDLREAA